ncbi:MAG: beta-galactosidase [Pseudomonadota bacterium]
MTPRLGVCFYPEHWPRDSWPAHAAQMRALGIGVVRIGEFAWSLLEPREGEYDWEWLDSALDVLADAGLEVILGTPTACPPAWLVQTYPDVLPTGADGRKRGFGSRRHYCFSSQRYRALCTGIVTEMLERYSNRAEIIGWQTDNEFGCHDTTWSYGSDVESAFAAWLQARYGAIESLNEAWGTRFWSQTYAEFTDIALPGRAVTEENPAHRLAFRRFASDSVRSFNAAQCRTIRSSVSSDTWITHNFMGNFTDFDHFDVAQELDIATWDSYPLGFLDQSWLSEATKERYRRTGHPDWAAFHHDLYRGVGRGRFGVMEQQPGPVNWAAHNATPLPGMVRLWSFEAIAHGAELVSYFRWQQYPKAQEQMHAALNLPNGDPAPAQNEVQRLASELRDLGDLQPASSRVALVFDYPSLWMSRIQPQAASYDGFEQCFDYYCAARRLGLDIDIVPPDAELSSYDLILLPAVIQLSAKTVAALQSSGAALIVGPRCGSKTPECSLPDDLPPGALQRLLPLKVTAVDSVRAGCDVPFRYHGRNHSARSWIETVSSALTPEVQTNDGRGVLFVAGNCHYLTAVTDLEFLIRLLERVCRSAGIPVCPVRDGLRLRRRGKLTFAFNYGPGEARLPSDARSLIVGEQSLKPADLAIWMTTD